MNPFLHKLREQPLLCDGADSDDVTPAGQQRSAWSSWSSTGQTG